jgi:hypothetical protein
MSALEKKISGALADVAVASADLAALISELEAGIAEANENAESERVQALDPLASPDPKASREALEAARFERDRLCTLLPRLKQRYQQVANQETYDHWATEFDQFVPRYDVAVATLKSVYEGFEAKIVAALVEAQAVDTEARRLARAKPYHLLQTNNDGRNLPEVELAARGLAGVAPGCSIVKDMKLPAFAEPNRLAWPPPQPSLAVEVAKQIAVMRRHPGADWYKETGERDRAIAAASREHMGRQIREREQRFYEQQERERAADEQRCDALRRATGWPLWAPPRSE